jgi:RNA polymerase sigma-70 factor (ECF subfamily)
MDAPLTLVKLAAEGDRSAFAQLVEIEYDFIFRTAWKWTRNQADAEDVAQEVCIRLGKAINGFKGYGRFETWLYTLVLNAVRDMARKWSSDRRKHEAWGAEASLPVDGGDDDGEAELWTAVQRLPDKQRHCVMLVYAEGMTHAQASDVLGVAEKTIGWHLHEAKKRLREIVGGEVAYG